MSSTIIAISPGREIVVSSDLGITRISIWANGGNLGVEISPEAAIKLSRALWYAAPIEARRAETVKLGSVHESGKSRP